MPKALIFAFAFIFNLTSLLAQDVRYISAPKLNLRQTPSKGGTIIQSLPKGTKVELIESQNSWAKVSVNGVIGFLSSSFLTDSSEKPAQLATSSDVQSSIVSNPEESTKNSSPLVYICDSKTAYSYHRSNSCRGLNRCSHGVSSTTQQEAENGLGRKSCKICY